MKIGKVRFFIILTLSLGSLFASGEKPRFEITLPDNSKIAIEKDKGVNRLVKYNPDGTVNKLFAKKELRWPVGFTKINSLTLDNNNNIVVNTTQWNASSDPKTYPIHIKTISPAGDLIAEKIWKAK